MDIVEPASMPEKKDIVLRLFSTRETPFVEISRSGYIKIIGNSMMMEPLEFYQSLFSVIDAIYSANIYITIKLVKINVPSTRHLFLFFERLLQLQVVTDISTFWIYEEKGDDFHQIGQIFKESLPNVTFNFFKI